MNPQLEDRLRAHFADRAEREPLPGPAVDVALARTVAHEPRTELRPRRHRRQMVLAAAALATAAAVAGVFVFVDDDRPNEIITTTDPSTTEQTATTAGPAPTAPPTTATRSALPAGWSVVVSTDAVLGWWDGERWVNGDSGAPVPVEAGQEFRLVRLDEPVTSAYGEAPVAADAPPCAAPRIDFGVEPPADPLSPPPIGVAGAGVLMPRLLRELETPLEETLAAFDVVADLGIDDPNPDVAQVVRTDLDGDGTEESVVVAERISNRDTLVAGLGDYSVVFVRRLRAGVVVNEVLAQSIGEPPFAEFRRVVAIADLNDDGRMELVTENVYYEGRSTTVYEVRDDGQLVEVLSGGCGV